MTFKSNDGPLFTETFGPLVGLKEEWAEQGATDEELDLSAFRYRAPMRGWIPVHCGWLHRKKQEVVEESSEFLITLDHMGRRMKLMKGKATLPHPLNFPVSTMDDWLKIKHQYEYSESRLAADWAAVAKEHLASQRSTTVTMPGAFDEPRQLMGEEALCMAYLDQPELIHDILDTICDTALRVFDKVSAEVQVDELWMSEDLAGKSGPMAGPRQFNEFLGPYYARVWDLLKSRGARLFGIDSDGDLRSVIPNFIESGINVLSPNEPASYMDIVKLREEYGTKLALNGGIDKYVLQRTQAEITEELDYKLPPMIKSGGCVLGLDHRIPNGTSLQNYRFYIDEVWRIMGSAS